MHTNNCAYINGINVMWPPVQTGADVHAHITCSCILTSPVESQKCCGCQLQPDGVLWHSHMWTALTRAASFTSSAACALVRGPLGRHCAWRAAEVSVCSLLQPFSVHHVSQKHFHVNTAGKTGCRSTVSCSCTISWVKTWKIIEQMLNISVRTLLQNFSL